MNCKTSTLISVGISLSLIAAGIWFIHDHLAGLELDTRSRPETHHAIMANGKGVIMFMDRNHDFKMGLALPAF